MIIGIDIDDTLTSLTKIKHKWCKKYIKQKGWQYKLVNKNARFIKDKFNMSEEHLNELWFDIADKMLNTAKPRKGASKYITKLKNQGHKILIITARHVRWHKDPYNMSVEWLQKNNIPYDELLVGNEKKDTICLEKKIDYLIDDYQENILSLHAVGLKTIMITTPNNKKFIVPNTCVKLKNWKSIYNFLQKQNNNNLMV